jgi:hypothetical protein
MLLLLEDPSVALPTPAILNKMEWQIFHVVGYVKYFSHLLPSTNNATS